MHRILPWATTVLSLAVTLAVFVTARGATHQRTEDRLTAIADGVATALGTALDRYADVLRAMDGLLGASQNVTIDEFSGFVDSLELTTRFPGADAVLRVRRETSGTLIVEDAAGTGTTSVGESLGDDLAAVLDDTLTAAAATGTTTMSAPSAADGPDGDEAPFVVLVHPTGPDEWLLLRIDTTAFVTTADGLPDADAVWVADRTDGLDGAPIVGATSGSGSASGGHTATAEVERFGRRWLVTLDHRDELVSTIERDLPWILLCGGLLLTAGLATTFSVQAAGRRQALLLADQASRSERVRRELIETAPVAIIEVDEAGLVRIWNRAAFELLGIDADEAIGHPLDLPVSEDVQRTGLAAAFAGLEGRRLTLATRHGERTVTAFTRCDDVRHQVLILVDETAKVALSRQLEQAQKLEVFGRLSGGIAHDFNNLLTPILGYLDMVLLRAQVGDADRGALQEARRAADRAAALVAKLLAVTRPPTGAVVPLDAVRTVDELSGLLTAAAGGDVVRVEGWSEREEPPFVRIDRTQLEQVLLNLVVNAHEAMERPGRITITVSSDHDTVTIRVADDGHGMDAATQAAMFEPFFSTKVERGGTGLGLATVYSIVTAAGGSIQVDSEPGHGTCIEILLPRARPGTPAAPAATPNAAAAHATATILLVEDDPAVRRLATTVLRDDGYEVVAVDSAAEAIDAFARLDGTLDLLLTDVMLRGASGTELASMLLAVRPDLHVLFMSGYTDGHFGAAGELPPGTRLLAKPFRVEDLLGHVSDALRAPS